MPSSLMDTERAQGSDKMAPIYRGWLNLAVCCDFNDFVYLQIFYFYSLRFCLFHFHIHKLKLLCLYCTAFESIVFNSRRFS